MARPRKASPADTSLVVGYLRVSTQEQVDSAAGLTAQRLAIQAAADRRGWTVVAWCADEGVSGSSTQGRPGLAEALALIRSGQAGTLMASKLDRLFRSLQDFATTMAASLAEGWSLVALDLGVDTSSPSGRFMATVMAGAAQWEREIIGQRTKDALAVKRAQGVRLGAPQKLPQHVVDRIVAERAAGGTLAAIGAALEAEGVATARGGPRWWPATLSAVLASQAAQPDGDTRRRHLTVAAAATA